LQHFLLFVGSVSVCGGQFNILLTAYAQGYARPMLAGLLVVVGISLSTLKIRCIYYKPYNFPRISGDFVGSAYTAYTAYKIMGAQTGKV